MADDLLRELRALEEDYPGQPRLAQRSDLREINRLRAHLGMPPVDDALKEVVAAPVEPPRPPPTVPEDHTAARAIYHTYLAKAAELAVHRAYADQVARATAGPSTTPVRPLATLGTGGGPLLCDHCGRPIKLEGGQFHGVTADVAWQRNPADGWTSYILGGMVVEIQSNGTLRIYHGYPGRNNDHCCNVAGRKDKAARDNFVPAKPPDTPRRLRAFLEHEFPALSKQERLNLLTEIVDTLYSYDPGLGVNRPPPAPTPRPASDTPPTEA